MNITKATTFVFHVGKKMQSRIVSIAKKEYQIKKDMKNGNQMGGAQVVEF